MRISLISGLGYGKFSKNIQQLHSFRKKNGFILLSDLYAESKKPTYVKMTGQQFIQLCDEWEEKVCKHRPEEVTIKHESDRFFIETNV